MRNKDIKRTYFMYSPYECSAVEEYLEEMAEKGWLLQSVKRSFFKFKKIEKRRIKYSVDVLDRVSVFDHKDSDLALEYREYCKATGWTYICEDGKIQFFYTDSDNEIISIHTDEEEKFKVVFKSSMNSVYSQMLLIILVIFSMYRTLTSNAEALLATNVGTFLIALTFYFILMSIVEIISFYVWVVKARNHLKKNELIPYNSYKQLKRKNMLINVYYLILFIILIISVIFDIPGSSKLNIPMAFIMIVPMIIISNVKKFTDKRDYTRDSNMGIYIGSTLVALLVMFVLSSVFRPNTNINTNTKQSEVLENRAKLTFRDFGYKKSEEKNLYIEFDKSILANRTKYSSGNGYNSLEYTIFQSQYPLLIRLQENSVVNRYKKYMHFKQEKTNLPSNVKVYFGSSSNFIVIVSKDKVIFIVKKLSLSSDEFLDIAYKRFFTQ